MRCTGSEFGEKAPHSVILGLEPRIHASLMMEASVDPRVELEDDGVWGNLCGKYRDHDKIGA